MTDQKRSLFPPLECRHSGHLDVGNGHQIYYEESGNPDGKPVIFVHGGPGGGTRPKQRQWWDPEKYRIILFDQRGCGQSLPHACLDHNTTPDLIADMEMLRQHLGIEKWQLFGGSWGSTLSLAYAQAHPERVSELVLRGIFLVRQREIHWFYQEGASRIFPDAWETYLAPIPEAERGDLLAAYYRLLTSDNEQERRAAAKAWSQWEGMTSFLIPDAEMIARTGQDLFSLALARIECHYFVNEAFMEDGQLLKKEQIDRIRHIPGVIVQGRYDVVCPAESAWQLHRAWPEAEFKMIPDAGHSADEPGIVDALVQATEDFAS